MPSQLTDALPQENDGQRIGRLADQCFQANRPTSWRVDATDGDGDFGYDYQLQIVDSGLVKDIFRAQLKGTTRPTLNSAGTEFSVPIKVSTANYYARATEPVLLILCDLTVDPAHPKNCHLYWQWIHDDLRRIRENGVPEGQGSVTFHVPVANNLDDSTNLSGHIARFRQLAQIGDQIDVIVARDKPTLTSYERAEFASKIVPNLERKSAALIDALTDDSQSSWVDAPAGTLPWQLKEASSALKSGSVEGARRALDAAAGLLENAKPLENADYWHEVGRLRSFMLDDAGARDAFAEACKFSDDLERHIVPWAETEMRLRLRGVAAPCDFSDVIARLQGSSPAVAAIRARLTAAEGRYKDAIAITDPIEGPERHFARAIIFSMQSKWNESIDACEAGLNDRLTRSATKQLFLILRARARFSMALGAIDFGVEPEMILPISGPAGTSPDLLRAAWNDIAEAITAFRSAGWPTNVEFISDLWPALAGMLGLQKQTLPLLKEAGAARPTLRILQLGLETIAAQVGDFGLALEANARQPENERNLLQRIVLLHMAGRHHECVSLMEAKRGSLSDDHPMLGYAMAHAIFSAEKCIRPELAKRWTEELGTKTELTAHNALFNYFRTVSKQLLAKDIALAELIAKYESLGRPLFIAKHLINELDGMDEKQAAQCVEIAVALKSAQMLDIDDSTRLAQALTTLHRWDDLLELSKQALNQFEGNDRLSAIGAIALDNLGRTAEAHELLKGLVEKADPDDLAMAIYIRIASRSGFADQAMAAIEKVYEGEKAKPKQLECLRHLFSLLELSDPKNPRLIEISWAIGQIADQADEIQEGIFLTTMLAATLIVNEPLSEEKKAAFNNRMVAFTTNFPNSRILKRATLPDNASAGDLMRILDEVTGSDEGQRQWRRKIQAELHHGTAPIPYAWRPRQVLDGISDVATLWEVSKQSSWNDRQLHLTMALNDWQQTPLAKLRGQVPLLDLLTLMVVADLDLIDAMFKLFPRIAIGKATLLELQTLLSPMSGSPFRSKLLSLQATLKERFQNIEQPSAEPSGENLSVKWRLNCEEIVEIIKTTNRYMVYSDDVLFRIYANPPTNNPPSICTLDLLYALDEAGILSAKEVANRIATLCSWRVGKLVIAMRYQLAILPDTLGSAKSISAAIDVLMADHLCNAMFMGIWDTGKPFGELQGHAGFIVRELVDDDRNSLQSVAALAGFWIGKVKLHTEAPVPIERMAALLIMQAAFVDRPLGPNGARRLWGVYQGLIQNEHGIYMDHDKERRSIQVIGEVAAETDQRQSLTGERSLRTRLAKGLTEGTSEYDLFTNAYASKLMSMVLQSQLTSAKR
jgi:tetratricopeptide (TPR) repeat protein